MFDMTSELPLTRFAAVGLNHAHSYGMTRALLGAGAELAGFYAPEDDLATEYERAFLQAERVTDREKLLENERIHLIISAAIPAERAGIGLEALQRGKDFLADKPGFVTLEALGRHELLCAETGRVVTLPLSPENPYYRDWRPAHYRTETL